MTHIICDDPITNTKTLVEHLQRVGVVICHDQDLSNNELVSFCKSIGECETPEAFMNPKEYPEIFKVTGKRKDDGSKIGMFGDTELGWHSNGNSRRNIDKICVTLYCKVSDENTTTSFCNTSRPFYDLSEEQQEYYKDIKIRLAFVNNTVHNYPIKLKSRQKPHYRVAVGVIWKNKKILISKRREKGLLGGLWEFPGGKIEGGESVKNCIIREVQEELGVCVKPTFFLKQIKHAYTHFSITLDAYYCEFKGGVPQALGCADWQWITPEQIQGLPFPKANHKLFDKVLPARSQ